MNLPRYGWSRWTCFVRSRSGSSRSDQESSRSIRRRARPASGHAAGSRAPRVLRPLGAGEAACALRTPRARARACRPRSGDDVETSTSQLGELRVSPRATPRPPAAAGAASPAPTISSGSPKPPPDFAFTSQKTSRPAAPHDEVELVAADPDVRRRGCGSRAAGSATARGARRASRSRGCYAARGGLRLRLHP